MVDDDMLKMVRITKKLAIPYHLMAHNPLCEGISPLLTRDVVLSLKRRGITSVGQLICSAADVVSRYSGLSHAQVREVQHLLLSKYGPQAVSGRTLLKQAQDSSCIFPFGCNSIDALLKGGIFSAELTELWGPAGSGKTQLCMSLTCAAISASPCTVAYVDGSAGGFSPTHLEQHLRARVGVAQGEEGLLGYLLEKVRVYRVFSVFSLLSLLHLLQYHISNETDCFYANLRLLIIDPVTLYLSPLLGPQQGHGLMGQVIQVMRTLAHEDLISVLYCNNVVASGTCGGLKPALGHTWALIPSTRLSLSSTHASGGSWKQLSVTKSPRQANGVADFGIADSGLISGHLGI